MQFGGNGGIEMKINNGVEKEMQRIKRLLNKMIEDLRRANEQKLKYDKRRRH